jgi:beta-lactamase class A
VKDSGSCSLGQDARAGYAPPTSTAKARLSAGGDELAVAALVFKVAVALEVFTQAATGRLDHGRRIRVSSAQRTPGPTGLSVFADEADDQRQRGH